MKGVLTSIVASFAIEVGLVVRLPWSAIWYQHKKNCIHRCKVLDTMM